MKLSALLRERRKAKGLTQQQVAEALNISRLIYWRYEQDSDNNETPYLDTALKLAALLEFSLGEVTCEKKFPQLLRKYRIKHRLNLKRAAEHTGLTVSSYWRLEHTPRKCGARMGTVMDLAKKYGYSTGDLSAI